MVLLSISEVGIAKQSKPIVEKEIEEKVLFLYIHIYLYSLVLIVFLFIIH